MTEWSAPDNAPARMIFDATLAREQQALRGFVRGLTGEAEQARDITQDVFMVAWRAAKQGAPPFTKDADERAIRRWLYCVAYRRAISVKRLRPVRLDPQARPPERDWRRQGLSDERICCWRRSRRSSRSYLDAQQRQ
jgi:DNA-directed RNA polymerase specialized sigma24 family protein